MFKNLFDLSVKRTPKQAVGFYIVWMLLGGFLCGILSAGLAPIFFPEAKTFDEGFRVGLFLGPILAVFVGAILSVSMICVRKLWKNSIALVLFLISLPVLFFGGTFLGMIPIAVLSTLGLELSGDEKCEENIETQK